MKNDASFSQIVKAELQGVSGQFDDSRMFVRECFLQGGVISNPGRTYHLEFTLDENRANKLMRILAGFNLQAKKIARRGQYVVYLKEAEGISDVLNIIGAHKSLLTLEGMRVEKSIRNEVNRKVNFETANINKTAQAALGQIEAIEFIRRHVGLSFLSEPLEEVARLRLNHETLNLVEIGALLTPPIGKSGVNHRLRKICEIAQKMKEGVLL